jgi:putative ABC transport system permease protein
LPRLGEVRIDPAVAGFAALLSISTGLLFGVFPALHSTQATSAQALRDAGRGLLTGGGRRLRGILVVGQMALALVLLAGAGLLVRSFLRLQRVDPGFRTENALTFRISLPESAYPTEARRSAFSEELLTRLSALPGVQDQGAVAGLPLSGTRFTISFTVEGRPPFRPRSSRRWSAVALRAISGAWAFPSGAAGASSPGSQDRRWWS